MLGHQSPQGRFAQSAANVWQRKSTVIRKAWL